MEERALALINDHTFTLDDLTVTLFGKRVIPRGKYVPKFSHPYFVFIAVTEGKMLLSLSGGSLTLSRGEYVIIAPGCDHIPKFLSEETRVFCLSAFLSGNEHSESLSLYGSLSERLESLSGRVMSDSATFDAINATIAALEGSRYLVISEFSRLLGILLPSDPSGGRFGGQDTCLARLHRINTVANVYYDRNISVEELARMLYLSPRQLSRIIESTYGMGWSALINERRMKVARDLIESSDMTVEQIAEYVGFSTPRGFYSAYKRYYGKTPKQSSGVEHTFDE